MLTIMSGFPEAVVPFFQAYIETRKKSKATLMNSRGVLHSQGPKHFLQIIFEWHPVKTQTLLSVIKAEMY